MARVRWYSQAACFAVLTSLFLTACSGSGTAPPVSSPGGGSPSSIAASGGTAPASTSRFLKSVSGSDSTPIRYYTHPHFKFAMAAAAKPLQFPAPSQCVAAFGIACYTPQLIHSAYNVPASLDGTGQTIVIVDAFGSPTIATDLQIFDAEFGLPDPQLNIIYPEGQPPAFDPTNADMASWVGETSLDVEWAHAMAPGATIDLVIAPTDVGSPLDDAVAYAVRNHLGNIMSLSWGTPEAAISGLQANIQLIKSDITYAIAAAQGMTVLSGAGDWGATNGAILSASGFYPTPNPLYPGSDPLVTSVGGTDLFMSDSGVYQSEYVWNDSIAAQCPFGCVAGIFGATGGAPSDIFAAPPYQFFLTHQRARTTADVTFNASVYTAVLVVISALPTPPTCPTAPCPAFYFFGGTSEGGPQWAGIVAMADQALGGHKSIGFMNPKLYAIASNPAKYASDFHDVTFGSNSWGGPGFSAGRGYDLPSGLGSPNVSNLIHDLIASTPRR